MVRKRPKSACKCPKTALVRPFNCLLSDAFCGGGGQNANFRTLKCTFWNSRVSGSVWGRDDRNTSQKKGNNPRKINLGRISLQLSCQIFDRCLADFGLQSLPQSLATGDALSVHYSAIGDTLSCDAPYSAIVFRGKLLLRYLPP